MYVSIGVGFLYGVSTVEILKVNKSRNEAQINMAKFEGLLFMIPIILSVWVREFSDFLATCSKLP